MLQYIHSRHIIWNQDKPTKCVENIEIQHLSNRNMRRYRCRVCDVQVRELPFIQRLTCRWEHTDFSIYGLCVASTEIVVDNIEYTTVLASSFGFRCALLFPLSWSAGAVNEVEYNSMF